MNRKKSQQLAIFALSMGMMFGLLMLLVGLVLFPLGVWRFIMVPPHKGPELALSMVLVGKGAMMSLLTAFLSQYLIRQISDSEEKQACNHE